MPLSAILKYDGVNSRRRGAQYRTVSTSAVSTLRDLYTTITFYMYSTYISTPEASRLSPAITQEVSP